MLNKLAVRNAKRSMRDYLVYFITMTIISTLMFAFNSMVFSKDIRALCTMAGIMEAMIGFATVFIIIIIAWLINYMVSFMREKKSKEFGTYLLIGMKKKDVAKLFMRENQLLGAIAFVPGIALGTLLQQVLTSIFYSVFNKGYEISIEFSIAALLLTLVLYVFIYYLALIKNKKKFKKMTIHDMMYLDKQNDSLGEKNSKVKQLLFFLSIIYFIIFNVLVFKGSLSVGIFFLLLLGLVVAIYLMYCGVSSFVIQYIAKQKNGVYKRGRLFLLRQFASKIKTMQFTMGTLTILFTVALLAGTVAMMMTDYNKKELGKAIAFDVMIFSDETVEDFKEEIDLIKSENKILEKRIYSIYQDKTDNMNQFIYSNSQYFLEDPSKALKDKDQNSNEYYDYDTYMKASDYNALREMLGYEKINLSEEEYAIHIKNRLKETAEKYSEENKLIKGGQELNCEGIYTESFSQNGANGSDYIIVVPDVLAEKMNKFYSLLAVDLEGDAEEGLQGKLEKLDKFTEDYDFRTSKITYAYGTEQIFNFASTTTVKTNVMNETKFMMTMITYPLVYIALVFVCVALTILSVQQLSDSNKYKFRYSVLSKLGLKEREIDKIILKQLGIYYLCPLLMAVAISIVSALSLSERFVFYTGVESSMFLYYGVSLLVLSIVYAIYFIATFIGFKRNIHGDRN